MKTPKKNVENTDDKEHLNSNLDEPTSNKRVTDDDDDDEDFDSLDDLAGFDDLDSLDDEDDDDDY